METLLQHLPQSASPAPATPLPMRLNGGFSHPQMSRFIAEVERRYRRDDMDSFWELEDEFRQLCRAMRFCSSSGRTGSDGRNSGPHRAMAAESTDHSPWTRVRTVGLDGRTGASLHSFNLFPGHVCADRCGLPGLRDLQAAPDYRNSMFDPAVKLEPAGTGLTAPGGILLLQSKQYAYDFQVARPQPVLKFATASFEPMEWLSRRTVCRHGRRTTANWCGRNCALPPTCSAALRTHRRARRWSS